MIEMPTKNYVDQSGRRTLYEAYSSGQLMLENGDANG